MLKKLFIALLLGGWAVSASAQIGVGPVKSIKLTGYIGKRVDQCIELQTKTQDLDELIAVFTRQDESQFWQTEFLGKWIVAAVLSYRYNNDPVLLEKIKYAADGLMKNQLPNGYIGNYTPEAQLQGWDVWGRKQTLFGLLAYYDLTGDKNALISSIKLVDHLIKQTGNGEGVVKSGYFRGMPSLSIVEALILLYKRTNEQQYLDFANSIIESVEIPEGLQLISKALNDVPVAERFPYYVKPWFGREFGSKANEMIESYLSILSLYEVTNNAIYLNAVEKTAANIIEDELNIVGSGGANESWYGGTLKQTSPTLYMLETCDAYCFLRLFNRLNITTGYSSYADLMERNIYNALMAPIKQDGTEIGQYLPLEGFRHKAKGQCDMSLTCCWGSIQRAYAMLPELVYHVNEEIINVNFYFPSKATIELDKNQIVLIEQKTDYPANEKVEFEVGLKKDANFVLALRIPEWSEKVSIQVNGQEVNNKIIRGAYYSINRNWKNGDKVTLTLP